MDASAVIIALGLLIFSAYLFNGLFSYTRIPNVLLLLLAGILFGPVTGWVEPADFGQVGPIFTSITLVLILFESGTKLQLSEVARSMGSATLLTVFHFLVTAAVAGGIAYGLAHVPPIGAAFFGCIVGGTSSAIVIPIVNQLGMDARGGAILLLESALSDVLCLVTGLSLLSAMEEGVFHLGPVLLGILRSFLIALVAGIVLGLIWSVVIKWIRRMQTPLFSNLAMVLLLYGAVEKLGFNGGIAVLGFGITLGNAHLLGKTSMGKWFASQELLLGEREFFAELAFIIQTYFFVYVGIHMQFAGWTPYLTALLIVVLILVMRPFIVRMLVRGKMPLKDLDTMAFMAPKGLVPAILASLPLQRGLAQGKPIQDLTYAMIFISILVCTLLIAFVQRHPFSVAGLKRKAKEEESKEVKW
ncbi:MAG: cation:proton antiporter [Flavobacteriales bacterium]|nr:cation:proton antiporter [Flavobacteriales bacterium]